MKDQIAGYRRLADEMLTIARLIEQACAIENPKQAMQLIENAHGRTMALSKLFGEFAVKLAEDDNVQRTLH